MTTRLRFRTFFLICCFFLFINQLYSQTNLWTWVNGDNIAEGPGSYGTQGIASSTNRPGARRRSSGWVDNVGNLWLLGGNTGAGDFNDLWKYTSSTNQWTWVNGDNTLNIQGIYGTKGIASPANKPGARSYGSLTWSDASGNLWLFGGDGYDATGNGYLNDLWKYTPATNQWTWINGENTADAVGSYGSIGVAGTSNIPGSRRYSVSWMDASGNFWLFGGDGYAATGTGLLNDLWKYNPSTNQWTWVNGSNTTDANGVYGVMGTAAAVNTPGARQAAVSWADASGNLWLFGGNGYAAASYGLLNDLWKYNIALGQWTWVNGDNTVDGIGVYGTQGTAAITNKPGARQYSIGWVNAAAGTLYLFGGDDMSVSGNYLNDVWQYSIYSNQWTWVKGSNVPGGADVYGMQGVTANGNTPGGRRFSNSWSDASGQYWLFGGNGNDGNKNDLWMYTPASILPVDLLSFTVKLENNHAKLEWKTANEVNLNRYEIEKSDDGRSFITTGVQKAQGSGSYVFTDGLSFVKSEQVYYRLKKIDMDGKFNYSKIVNLKVLNTIKFAVLPTITANGFTIYLNGNIASDFDIEIIDIVGKKMLVHHGLTGERTLNVDTRNWNSGTYLVTFNGKTERYTSRVIINR